MSEPRGKLAIYWAASCGGCDIAVLGLQEKILDLAEAFDIVFWPCVMDAKVPDVEALPNKSIDLCLFNGAVRTSEQEFMARLLRDKILCRRSWEAHDSSIRDYLRRRIQRQWINRTPGFTEFENELYPRAEFKSRTDSELKAGT